LPKRAADYTESATLKTAQKKAPGVGWPINCCGERAPDQST